MGMAKTTSSILEKTQDTLNTAKLGLKLLGSANPNERMAGLRNLVVFGRAVTNVLQNLRSTELDFDSWYAKYKSEMESDPLMKFFYKLRSKILKEGDLNIHTSMTFSGNPYELIKRSQPPPGAKGFFIGDQIGGSGWEVELPDGSVAKYYVAIPSDLPNFDLSIRIHLSEAPDQFRRTPVEELCVKYISYLDGMVQEAMRHFTKRDA
jgi:hypothetical protein